ncbi:MAG: hypothetical protein N3E49_06560 [Bacteroidia bacterium]|nr:hypothetical protein [Bacteroidia bacterium]
MYTAVYAITGPLYEGQAQRVAATSLEGAFEVWEGHAPFIAQLAKGEVRLSTSEGEKVFPIHGGFLWVLPDGAVRILVR